MSKRIKIGYLLPSLIYLMVVLASGVLLRFQWIWPEFTIFNPRYLIHSHSHLAMLGWLFPVIAALLIHHFVPKNNQRTLSSAWLLVPLHVIIVIMTISFAMEGYAFWSITSSTFFIALSTIWTLIFLIKMSDDGSPSSLLIKSSLFVYMFSNVGPLALSGGTMYGEPWIVFWVTFYLHFQLSGWLALAILGILLRIILEGDKLQLPHKKFMISIYTYIIGSVLLFEPMIRSQQLYEIPQWVGLIGGLLLLGSTWVLLTGSLKKVYKTLLTVHSPRLGEPLLKTSLLLVLIGICGFIIKAIFQLISSIPDLGHLFIETHYLKVAFSHFLLLTTYTISLIGLIQMSGNKVNAKNLLNTTGVNLVNPHIQSTGQAHGVLSSFGAITFVTGTTTMVILLFYTGIHQFLGILPLIPVQESLFATGAVSLIGFIAWFPSLVKG